MSEAVSASPPSIARFWAFAGIALIVGPAVTAATGLISQKSIMFSIPVVIVALVAVSFAFGLWTRGSQMGLKIGAALWIVLVSLMSPFLLFVVATYVCAIQNGFSGHYVCGL
jgi:hypothetical protein